MTGKIIYPYLSLHVVDMNDNVYPVNTALSVTHNFRHLRLQTNQCLLLIGILGVEMGHTFKFCGLHWFLHGDPDTGLQHRLNFLIWPIKSNQWIFYTKLREFLILQITHTQTHTQRHNIFPVFSSFNITFISMLCIVYKEFKRSVDGTKENKSGRQKVCMESPGTGEGMGWTGEAGGEEKHGYDKSPSSSASPSSSCSSPFALQPANKCPFNFRWIIKDKVRMSLFFHIMQLWEISQSVMFALHREIEKER